MDTSASGSVLTLLLVSFLFLSLSADMTGQFKCIDNAGDSPSTCLSLVGYSSKNATTLGNIQALFSVKKLHLILEANNLSLSTTRDKLVEPNQVVRVPIPCVCSDGTGLSNRVPVYTVKKGDRLVFIAHDVYGALTQYQKISEVNNLPDASKIVVGQKLWIPLPCSCDKLNGQDVVHYAHVVKFGSFFNDIATQFGIDNATLARLNGISGDAQLLADYPLNIPLKACSSSVRNDSLDSKMHLTNNSFSITANNCIKCYCDASNSWTLSCVPVQQESSSWQICPSARCEGAESLFVGSTANTSCGTRTCTYAGYSNQTIFTVLSPDSCLVSGASGVTGKYASALGLTLCVLLFLYLL